MLRRLEPSEPALACLWGSPPLWPLPSFYARHGLGSPLPLWPPLTLCCSFLSPFTSLHSPPSCPIPSCLILPQSLLDFHDLYMPVTPKPVFAARSFFYRAQTQWSSCQLEILIGCLAGLLMQYALILSLSSTSAALPLWSLFQRRAPPLPFLLSFASTPYPVSH